MNTQETLEQLVKDFETQVRENDPLVVNHEMIIAYCLCVIARSLTR